MRSMCEPSPASSDHQSPNPLLHLVTPWTLRSSQLVVDVCRKTKAPIRHLDTISHSPTAPSYSHAHHPLSAQVIWISKRIKQNVLLSHTRDDTMDNNTNKKSPTSSCVQQGRIQEAFLGDPKPLFGDKVCGFRSAGRCQVSEDNFAINIWAKQLSIVQPCMWNGMFADSRWGSRRQ